MIDLLAFVAFMAFLLMDLPKGSLAREAQRRSWHALIFSAIGATVYEIITGFASGFFGWPL
jgi:hypothetical protein